MAHSDTQKRKEIYLEFVYYIFDSLLIPLIRSNFHVTESNTHRNRLFYFRHDVWRRLTEPSLASLKLSMFEELKPTHAKHLLNARSLGFSQVRLLPKRTGFRPIMNLRRRMTETHRGKVLLGRSINSVMAPVFHMLDYEKAKQPDLVGSALFSVADMYLKVKAFQRHLRSRDSLGKPLYFVKVDVQSCFDTIPQRRVVRLMGNIASEAAYKIARHAEVKSSTARGYDPNIRKTSAPARKFIASARALTDFQPFAHRVQGQLAKGKRNTIFVDTIVETNQERDALLGLLEEHVERNVVKIGNRYYRQKAGIPQGSILSSLLCNYFYAELEKEQLGFVHEDESILLRLIDDFLFITTSRDHAQRFSHIMHRGVEKYGVMVNPAKSLANFDLSVNGHRIPRLDAGTSFPYCGNMIDTRSLEITKDTARRKGTGRGTR
jgi:telomerase reverse transcriptase